MEQPLDLSLTTTKNTFTIEYLTSNVHKPKRKPEFYYHQSPLNPVENKNCSLEIVNGGHGIKNPLFDCATEALQIKYGKTRIQNSILN